MSQRSDISQSIQVSFPNNTSQFITPAILRNEQGLFEQYVILNEQTASIIAQAVASSSAGNVTSTTFNAFTSSTNAFTGSIQTQVNALRAATSSYVTNAQTSSMSVLSASYASSSTSASYALTASFALNAGTTVDTGSFVTTSSFNAYTASTNTFTGSIQTQVNTLQSATASYVTNAQTGSFVTSAITGSSVITASVALNTITFTKGDASTFAVTVDTGSGGGGMNLGANTFTGSQTLSSSTIPASLIFRVSGSLAAFVTESNAVGTTNTGYGNIIFNARTTAANTGSTIISGSSNIVFDAGTTVTTPRGLSGLQNIGFVPVYSGSIPTFNQNYLAGTLTVSGSKMGFIGNNIIGAVTVTENNAASGAINNNIINGAQVVFSLNYSGSTGLFGNSINNNNINGSQHLIQIIGSGSQNRQFVGNTIGGQSITASLTTPTGSSNNSGSLMNTLIYGVGLIVSGTQINTTTLHGGAFVGRYNETASVPADNTIVFAVGAGTSNTARKTALFVSASGETVIGAAGGGLSSRGNTIFGNNNARIVQNTINQNTTCAPYSVTIASNGGGITDGESNILGGGEVNNITVARSSVVLAGSYNTINTTKASDSNNIILGGFDCRISGSTSLRTAIFASTGSSITGSQNSVIIGANNARLNNTTSSVALGRDTAYTASGSYTLYTQNVDISGSLTVNGNVQYNFGEFWATSSNTPAAGVSQSVIFDSTGVSAGVATSGSGDLLKITNAGTYNIQFSVQVNTSAGADTLYVWFKKNGTNIAASNSKAVLANNTAQLLTANILDTAAANDYYEIVYQTANGNAQILSEAATGNLPQIPSVITTITQVR